MRGSRKHVLDWTSTHDFLSSLEELVRPVEIKIGKDSRYMPSGPSSPKEARLETFGPKVYPEMKIWPKLRSRWLDHPAGANTPNWDVAVSCQIKGKPGFILIEAKANVPEFSRAGKRLDGKASERSRRNHERISAAINEASTALGGPELNVRLSRDRSYQLSNRIAFSWRLASWGIPVILVYLGFIGDRNIVDVGQPFRDDEDWLRVFNDHLAEIAPRGWVNSQIETGAAPFWILARSLPVV